MEVTPTDDLSLLKRCAMSLVRRRADWGLKFRRCMSPLPSFADVSLSRSRFWRGPIHAMYRSTHAVAVEDVKNIARPCGSWGMANIEAEPIRLDQPARAKRCSLPVTCKFPLPKPYPIQTSFLLALAGRRSAEQFV